MEYLLCLVQNQGKKSSEGLNPLDSRFRELSFQILFLRFHTEENFNETIFPNKLIKSFKSEAPRPKNVFPKWNLAVILNFLNQPLFEPLSQAELRFLTWKTVFLVTMALAVRSSEERTWALLIWGLQSYPLHQTFNPKPTDKLSWKFLLWAYWSEVSMRIRCFVLFAP